MNGKKHNTKKKITDTKDRIFSPVSREARPISFVTLNDMYDKSKKRRNSPSRGIDYLSHYRNIELTKLVERSIDKRVSLSRVIPPVGSFAPESTIIAACVIDIQHIPLSIILDRLL